MNPNLLSQFLLDRIAEDEAVARDANHFVEGAAVEVRQGYLRHLARWRPTNVLAECEAKRLLVERHAEVWHGGIGGLSPMNAYIQKGRLGGLWEGLKHLALPYADHPDYHPDWKP